MSGVPPNSYVNGPLGSVYAKTALPIIFVMGMNGVLTVTDAIFLGRFVGPDALAAVMLMFPIYMLIVALSTLVASGMSSLLARRLGAEQILEASAVFAGAHGLAVLVGLVLIGLYLLIGPAAALLVSGGSEKLAGMGLTYLRITVLFSPLMFVLALNSAALRNEGRVDVMTVMSLFTSLANIAFNYVLIAVLSMGIAGSAYGAAMAQALSLCILLAFRSRGRTVLRPSALWRHKPTSGWLRILALGLPQSLNFLGLALGSAATIAALQWVQTPQYEATVSAYGVITRVLTFVFLPLLGLSHAMQTITGNNFGARDFARVNASLKIAGTSALVYCVSTQFPAMLFAAEIGSIFVADPVVVAEIARILPVMASLFILAGPLMMIAVHFQAIGDAGRAAILGLSKPYLFGIPLTFLLACAFGEIGIWIASPMTECLHLGLTILMLRWTARVAPHRWGLFPAPSEGRL